MNCKPGDIAIIVRDASSIPLAGRLVEVMSEAPAHIPFDLPDGHLHGGTEPGRWICKSLGSPFPTTASIGSSRFPRPSMYAPIPDSALRPLRGEPEKVEEEDLEAVS